MFSYFLIYIGGYDELWIGIESAKVASRRNNDLWPSGDGLLFRWRFPGGKKRGAPLPTPPLPGGPVTSGWEGVISYMGGGGDRVLDPLRAPEHQLDLGRAGGAGHPLDQELRNLRRAQLPCHHRFAFIWVRFGL